jgi:hypothetical protein
MPVMWRAPGAVVKEGLRICLTHLFGFMNQPLAVPSDMNEATGDNTDKTTIDLHGLKCPLGSRYKSVDRLFEAKCPMPTVSQFKIRRAAGGARW